VGKLSPGEQARASSCTVLFYTRLGAREPALGNWPFRSPVACLNFAGAATAWQPVQTFGAVPQLF
jgi:hypothetical protein